MLRRASYGDYLLKRFARIYPVFIVTTLAVAALVVAAAIANVTLNSTGTRFTPVSFACNLVLLGGALPGCPAWNPPAWSVSMEMLAYVTFPVTAWVLVRLRTPRSATIAAIAWLLAGTSAMMAFRLVDDAWASPGMALLRITTEFVAGAMLWKAWSLAGEPRSLRWDVFAVGIVVFTVVVLRFLPPEDSVGLILTPLLAFLVVACASASGPVKWLLSTRVVMFGGQISYSLYMVHFIVLIVVGKVLPWQSFETASLLARVALMTFYILACFAIAVVCYLFLEEPARRAIQRVAERRAMRRRVSQS